MDDVNYDCWQSNPSIRNFMDSKRMHSIVQLEEYYSKRLIQIINKMGRSPVVWQDPFDKGIKVRKVEKTLYYRVPVIIKCSNKYIIF